MEFLSYLISGISLGSVYAIIALGYTMVYGIAKMLNFAHGDIIMVGGYISFCAMNYLGLPSIVGIILAILVCTVLGVVIEGLAYKPLRAAPSLAVLITAIGVSYFLQNAALLIWSAAPKVYTPIISGSLSLFGGALKIPYVSILTVVVCLVIMVALTAFTSMSKMGKAMRACSEDKGAAQLMGINVNATISMTFAIGSALAAIAGVLLCSTYHTLMPTTGSMPGIKAFTAAVFGGIGSIPGALLGGLLLVNEWHSRPSDFDESSLVSIMTYARSMGVTKSIWRNSDQRLFPVAANALLDALNAAKEAGLEGYVVREAYRSISDQQTLWDAEYNRLKGRHSAWTDDELIAATKKSINLPGTSEYNSGLAFTLYLYENGNDELNKMVFSESEQGKWMYENSWKYGLVFRFPLQDFPTKGTISRAYKTGVNVEMNLFRFVGIPNATVMHHLDMCLEEYIEYLMAHPHIAVFEDGQLKYEIVRQQVADPTPT